MIDFKGLDKTQIRYVERDCPDLQIFNQICINKFVDTNLILNNVVSDVIVEMTKLYPILPYMFSEGDDLLNKTRKTIEYHKLESFLEPPNAISSFILKFGKFNTKQHRALLAEIFGDKVHEEDFMTNLQFVISKIIYAILYV